MGSVRFIRRWPDGEILEIKVKAESAYPDALAEAKATALAALREASEIVMPIAEAEPEDE